MWPHHLDPMLLRGIGSGRSAPDILPAGTPASVSTLRLYGSVGLDPASWASILALTCKGVQLWDTWPPQVCSSGKRIDATVRHLRSLRVSGGNHRPFLGLNAAWNWTDLGSNFSSVFMCNLLESVCTPVKWTCRQLPTGLICSPNETVHTEH